MKYLILLFIVFIPIFIFGEEVIDREEMMTFYSEESEEIIDGDSFPEEREKKKEDLKKRTNTKAMSDYLHLNGVNFSDTISIDYVTVPIGQDPESTQHPVCEFLRLENNIYFTYVCLDGGYPGSSNSIFTNSSDYYEYGIDLGMNYYIVQGLTYNEYKNDLFISAYYCSSMDIANDCTNAGEKHSIIIRYSLDNDKIENIYPIEKYDDNGNQIFESIHVGGIGFYENQVYDFPYLIRYEHLFINDSPEINGVYHINQFMIVPGVGLYFLKRHKVSVKPSYLSSSNGYLWFGKFHKTYRNEKMQGVKITISQNPNGSREAILGNGVDQDGVVIPNYEVTVPKPDIQGVYCDSFKENGRSNFYFSASDNTTYVYQAVLNGKDINGDGIVNIEGDEWYWESFYCPFDPQIDKRKLPDGGEGLVKIGDSIWMLNEGASWYYCECWDWPGDDPIDCARELLEINPVDDDGDIEIVPSGSIALYGTGINDNWGKKVVVVLAQNKNGHFYYSFGELKDDDSLDYAPLTLYLNKPTVYNPYGFQASYSDERATAYVEDIKGLIIYNLEKTSGDTDDWNLSKIGVTFDANKEKEINFVPDPQTGLNFSYLYDHEYNIDVEFGDNSGDSKGIFISFNNIYKVSEDGDWLGDSYTTYSFIRTQASGYYYNLWDMFNSCYLSSTGCLTNNSIKNYFEDNIVCGASYFQGTLNSTSLDRINDIIFSSICD